MSEWPTKPARYDKNTIIYYNQKEYTLIGFLSEQRKNKKIKKKFISNIIKGNDYWYSQIDMGEKDNNRRHFINRDDLVDIISVIIFDAKSTFDLERFASDSCSYIDTVLNVTPYDEHPRYIPLYEMEKKIQNLNNSEYAESRIDTYLSAFNETMRNFYNTKRGNLFAQGAIINLLNILTLNLDANPEITLHYCSLPFSSFFACNAKEKAAADILEQELLSDIDALMDKYSKLLREEDLYVVLDKLQRHFNTTKNLNPFPSLLDEDNE